MRYLGGKSRISKKIREHLVSHNCHRYVEPFVGGGAVLTAVARDFTEVIAADAHADLIDMYRAIQDGWTPPFTVTEEDYYRLKAEPPSPLRTFAAFGASFGGKEWGGYGRSGKARDDRGGASGESARSVLKSAASGMFDRHVTFTAGSVFELDLPEDLSDTVIYCDPPYVEKSDQYEHDFSRENHEWLAHVTRRRFSQARVLISYYDHPLVRELYPEPFWRWKRLTSAKAMTGRGGGNDGGKTNAPEVLICNQR
jgi:DNA adenine methylase